MALIQEEMDVRKFLESGIWGEQLKTYVGAAATFALTTYGEKEGHHGRTPYLQLVEDGVRPINYDNGQPLLRVEFSCRRHFLQARLIAGDHQEAWSTRLVKKASTDELVRSGIHWVESFLFHAIWDCLFQWGFGIADSEFIAGGGSPWLSIPDVIELYEDNANPRGLLNYYVDFCRLNIGKGLKACRKETLNKSGNPYCGVALSVGWNRLRPVVTSVMPLGNKPLPQGEINRLLSQELVDLYSDKFAGP